MPRRDKIFYITVFFITTILVSMLFSEIYIRFRYGSYIQETYQNSEELVKKVERLDSLYSGT